MNAMLNELITAGIGMVIMAVFYTAWLLSGVFGVAYNKDRKWSWRRFLEDFLKLLLRCGSIAVYIVGCNLVNWYASRLGADISSLMDTIGTVGVLLLILKATLGYAEKAYQNFEQFFATRFTKSEVKLDGEPDFAGLVADTKEQIKAVAEMITPPHTVSEEQTEKQAEPSESELREIGQGADINPLNRILPDGDTDGGRGWQCSKYAWFLATGIRMNYAPHPDYGPCNGNEMVDYLISKLGWVECPKLNGAIFCYSAGAYGHTGIVKDAGSNLVNDANWSPLAVGTHYLNLDNVGARYACPKWMVEEKPAPSVPKPAEPSQGASATPPAPAPSPAAPSPAPEPIKVGDRVRPLRLVDYNGTHLQQWDESYVVTEVIGDRAVLSARGQIWAAMRVGDVERI